jgi:hypothetical protein
MGNEIEIWKPSKNRIVELRRCQLARQQAGTAKEVEARFQDHLVKHFRVGEVVDLLRVCAVYDRPYIARYIKGMDGCYHYSQTIQITKRSHREQYKDPSKGILVRSSDLAGEESCAWCRARGEEVGGSKSVLCAGCHMEICFGRTTADGYFHCRPSCPCHGQLGQPSHRPQQGFRPEIKEGL